MISFAAAGCKPMLGSCASRAMGREHSPGDRNQFCFKVGITHSTAGGVARSTDRSDVRQRIVRAADGTRSNMIELQTDCQAALAWNIDALGGGAAAEAALVVVAIKDNRPP